MSEGKGRQGRQLHIYVSDETAERLKKLAAKTDISQTKLVRRALELLFAEYEQPERKSRK